MLEQWNEQLAAPGVYTYLASVQNLTSDVSWGERGSRKAAGGSATPSSP